jgi:uncharacterized protein YjcR
MAHSKEKINHARKLFLKGLTTDEIAQQINIPSRTVSTWRLQGEWDDLIPQRTAEEEITARICVLTAKENKSKLEIEELAKLIDKLGDLALKLSNAKINEAKAFFIKNHGIIPAESEKKQTSLANKNKPKGKAVKNDISEITKEKLDEIRNKLFYAYQLDWNEAKLNPLTRRIRFILKSRQIGATYYFAWEAFEDAVLTGDNQIFLSASRNQSEVFKGYIIAFAKDFFEIQIAGTDFILLSNGAELRFLSTNSTTAQSYHGHLYIDEVFWIPNFEKVNKVASGMATHKKWRKTYFSTPSAQSHQAYPLWSGQKHNSKLPEAKRVPFDVEHKALKSGLLGADKIWRQIVTIEDADKIIKAEIAAGLKPDDEDHDLFDIEMLRFEYSLDEFNNLFMCKFIDDSKSVFNLQQLIDSSIELDEWLDYGKEKMRPFGNKPVLIGFDPSRSINGDHTSCAILSQPANQSSSFRLLKRHTYHGRNIAYQANRVKEICESHNVQHIGIDTTGMGLGVFEKIEEFYPLATAIHYSIETKNRLVIKGQDVVENKRFQFLAGDNEVIRAFLMITQKVTDNGQITYAANRTAESGHADIAWAVLHAMAFEPIRPRTTATVTFG